MTGYGLAEDRTDWISRCILQVIFFFKDRFYDFEKALGQEQGLAIHASRYGFTSDVMSEGDESGHGVINRTFGVNSLLNSGVFVLRGGRAAPGNQQRGEHYDVDETTRDVEAGRKRRSGVIAAPASAESSSHGLLDGDTSRVGQEQGAGGGPSGHPLIQAIVSPLLSALGGWEIFAGLFHGWAEVSRGRRNDSTCTEVGSSQSWDGTEKSERAADDVESVETSPPFGESNTFGSFSQSDISEHTLTSKAIANSIQKYNLTTASGQLSPTSQLGAISEWGHRGVVHLSSAFPDTVQADKNVTGVTLHDLTHVTETTNTNATDNTGMHTTETTDINATETTGVNATETTDMNATVTTDPNTKETTGVNTKEMVENECKAALPCTETDIVEMATLQVSEEEAAFHSLPTRGEFDSSEPFAQTFSDAVILPAPVTFNSDLDVLSASSLVTFPEPTDAVACSLVISPDSLALPDQTDIYVSLSRGRSSSIECMEDLYPVSVDEEDIVIVSTATSAPTQSDDHSPLPLATD